MMVREGEPVLVFQAGGKRLAVPASELLAVEPARISHLPMAEEAHLGLMRRQQTIFPVFDPLLLHGLGKLRTSPTLAILMESMGCSVGLACHRVEGSATLEGEINPVGAGFEALAAGWPVTLLDMQPVIASRLGSHSV